MSLSPQDYNKIARLVYQTDPIEYPKPADQLRIGDPIKVNGKPYQVIDAIGNDDEPTDNGLQAMAVAEAGECTFMLYYEWVGLSIDKIT